MERKIFSYLGKGWLHGFDAAVSAIKTFSWHSLDAVTLHSLPVEVWRLQRVSHYFRKGSTDNILSPVYWFTIISISNIYFIFIVLLQIVILAQQINNASCRTLMIGHCFPCAYGGSTSIVRGWMSTGWGRFQTSKPTFSSECGGPGGAAVM